MIVSYRRRHETWFDVVVHDFVQQTAGLLPSGSPVGMATGPGLHIDRLYTDNDDDYSARQFALGS